MTPDQVLEQSMLAVRFARNASDDVEFSPEDAGRSEPDFLCRVIEAVIKEGARRSTFPTRSATRCREQFGEFIRKLRERIPNSDKAVWSMHCHNDLGMAVANSLAAVHDRRRAPGRVHHQRPGRARRQHFARGDRDGGAHAQGLLRPATRASTRRRSCPRRGSCRRSPASRCSPTRPWSAPTRLRTSPASTRTACSRRARPTRSCAPKTWAGAPTASCSASSRAAPRSSSA